MSNASVLSCPSPYTLNSSLGLCVEPTPTGFVFINGEFLRACPTGMTMNELGVCIRPVMTRKSFVSDASIQQTKIAVGGNSAEGGSNAVVFGTYDPKAFDVTFQNAQALGNYINTIKVSPGSNTFLVGVNSAGTADSNTNSKSNTSNFDAVIAVTTQTNSVIQNTNSSIQVPTSVRRMEYASSGPAGQLYFLGTPATKISVADYSASLNASVQPKQISVHMLGDVYNVSGTTDPYYVGLVPRLLPSSATDSSLVSQFLGAFQSGSVEAGPVAPKALNNSERQALGSEGTDQGCQNDAYAPQWPLDPLPAGFFTQVTDATSRNFTIDVLQSSFGFILTGSQGQETGGASGQALPKALAVRYLQAGTGPNQDPCTLNPGQPFRPTIQALQDIQLEEFLVTDNIDIRLARFDVLSDPNGNPDTIYVFGNSSASSSAGRVLAFITENHGYNSVGQFVLSFGTGTGPPAVPPKSPQTITSAQSTNVNGVITLIDSFVSAPSQQNDSQANAQAFASRINTILSANNYTERVISVPQNASPTSLQFQLSGASETFSLSFAFIDNPNFKMLSTAQLLGFTVNQWNLLSANSPVTSAAGNASVTTDAVKYNGLNTTDNSAVGTGNVNAQTAMPVDYMNGQFIDAWSFDTESQSLAFSIFESTSSSALGDTNKQYSRTSTAYTTDGTFVVPQNCIDIEVHLWGAGGSCDAQGTGGSGAYVSGHLDLKKLNIQAGQSLKVTPGSGGTVEAKKLYGSGGSGNHGTIGKGGGRSTIQKGLVDLVVAGGGGGSSGTGQGGAASATDLDAESGLPAENGGLGASPTKAGLGGAVFGDSRVKRAPDGQFGRGAPSCSSLSKQFPGAGGGGSGYWGGGSGAYVGSKHASDLPTGSGGGSSYASNLIDAILVSGIRAVAPSTNAVPKAFRNAVPANVAAGGSAATNGLGADGFILIIATTQNSGPLGATAQSFNSQLWACRPRAMSVLPKPIYFGTYDGTLVRADWTDLFCLLQSPTEDLKVNAIFTGLEGLIILAQETATQDTRVSFTFLTEASVGTTAKPIMLQAVTSDPIDPFGPLNYLSSNGLVSFQVPKLTGIRSIRAIANTRDIIFVGSTVRILQAPSTLNGTFTNPRFVIDAQTELPLQMNLSDSEFNTVDQTVELIGQPQNLQIKTLHKTPWTPQFASFYESTDVVLEQVPYVAWQVYATNQAYSLNGLQAYSAFTNNPFERQGFTVNGLGPCLRQNASVLEPDIVPSYVSSDSSGKALDVPNLIFCARLLDAQNQVLVPFLALNLYNSPNANPSIGDIAKNMGDALQGYLNYCTSIQPTLAVGSNGPLVSVFVAPFGILSITITGLGLEAHIELIFTTVGPTGTWNWQSLFDATSTAPVTEEALNVVLRGCGNLLGFGPNFWPSVTEQTAPGVYESSIQGQNGIQLVPSTTAAVGPLTPLSLALPVNSTYAGSLYHTYNPTVKLASVDTSYQITKLSGGLAESLPMWSNGLCVAIGGPIASVVHTTNKNNNTASDPDLKSFLDQPVPMPGSKYCIDFVQSADGTYSWQYNDGSESSDILKSANWRSTLISEGAADLYANLRSPANILYSDDLSSYSYAESLLGGYLKDKGQVYASYFALTALDCFHTYAHTDPDNGQTVVSGIGPARFLKVLQDSTTAVSGYQPFLNACVSQFNDVKFFPYEAEYQGCIIPGFFMAVGQFLWELNAIASCTWPKGLNDLAGVAWVSLDGITWTTVPLVTAAQGENFWQVYRIDNVDLINDNATLITDLGLYMFNVARTMSVVCNLFATGPILDFSLTGALKNPLQSIYATPIGLSGPFSAQCTTRDATGTCIKCLKPLNGGPAAIPVSIPQIIGAGGAIQPNFDCCISCLRGDDFNASTVYTSVEAAIDAYGIAAYAGYDTNLQSRVRNYKQSFFAEGLGGSGDDSLIVCPRFTDVNETPSGVIGPDGIVSELMQCAINNNLEDQGPVAWQNVNGISMVRRFGSLQGPDTVVDSNGQAINYDGGLSATLKWPSSYVRQVRWLTLGAYDSSLSAVPSQLGLRIVVPDSCPSTLGIGGSAVQAPTNLGSDVYAPTLSSSSAIFNESTVDSNGIRTAITSKITNKGAFPGLGNVLLDGPFLQNQSTLSTAGGSWAPSRAPFDRAILANDDLQSDFSYANQGTALVYNAIDPTDGTKQTKNPFLFRLSSFEFPFDASLNGKLTIGRDPQVFEPGFGPLQNYLGPLKPGFARSKFNSATTPWPVWPLPEEGFGHWYIRPSVQTVTGIVNGAPNINGNTPGYNSIFQCALGYGSLIFQQQLGNYAAAAGAAAGAAGQAGHQGYSWPGGTRSNSNVTPTVAQPLFVYDTETLSNGQLQSLKYFEQNWTQYLPFQNGAPDDYDPRTYTLANAWLSLDAKNPRALRAKYSIQNVMHLKLFNKPEPVPSTLGSSVRSGTGQNSTNWKFLVALNFYRPRNWAFTGLLVDSTGALVTEDLGFGLQQQVLVSDQPNADGLYEFLVPDPFYSVWPNATGYGNRSHLIGIQTFLEPTSPGGPVDLPVIANVLKATQVPQCLTVIETPVTTAGSPGSALYAQQHVAFHYFSVGQQTATLDLFVNVTKLFAGTSEATTFQWLSNCTLPNQPFDPLLHMPDILTSIGSLGPQENGLVAALRQYTANPTMGGPLNSFTWTDPSAQTTRSLNSMNMQVPGFVTFQSAELLTTVEMSITGTQKRRKGLLTSASDYTGQTYSLLRHTYVINMQLLNQAQSPSFLVNNPNSVSLFAQDSVSSKSKNVALLDCRGLPVSDNFMFRPRGSVLNITSSDYQIEPDNSDLFVNNGIAIVQDLQAQTYPDADLYGSPSYGFGLRIDSDAVQLEVSNGTQARPTVSATTLADLPMDHGYVSMVRTVIDSFDRYTDPTITTGKLAGPLSIDATPHVTRMTYVTKYVPSTLQAYGATLTLQPMRFLPEGQSSSTGNSQLQGITATAGETLEQFDAAGSLQLVPNPFRPHGIVLVEQVPIGPQTITENSAIRPISAIWTRPSSYTAANYWTAWASTVFDLEAPGFWGRAQLPLLSSIGNAFFDALDSPIAGLYDKGPTMPFAGYEGLWDNSLAHLSSAVQSQNNGPQVQSFRSAFSSLADFQNASVNTLSGSVALYDAVVAGQSKAIVGQMLVNLLDCAPRTFTAPDTSPKLRLELGFRRDPNYLQDPDAQTYNSTYTRDTIGLYTFMTNYVFNEGAAYSVIMGRDIPNGPILVTHHEVSKIFTLALNNWMNASTALNVSGASVTCRFDALTDRPVFTVNFSSWCVRFRLFVPSPLSNWVGLKAVATPMINLTTSMSASTRMNYNGWYEDPAGNFLATNVFVNYAKLQADFFANYDEANANTSASRFVSPWEFIRIASDLFGKMDPAQGPECQSANPNWAAGAGAPFPYQWNFDGTNFNVQLVQRCSTISSVAMSIDPSDLLNWAPLIGNFIGVGINGHIYGYGSPSTQTISKALNLNGNGPLTYVSPGPDFGYVSQWKNSSTQVTSSTDRQGWSADGWTDTNSSPLYSLVFESTSGLKGTTPFSVTFNGRQGIKADGSFDLASDFTLCDISNVSWTTRLASNLQSATYSGMCTHWWGLASARPINSQFISVYHADSALTNYSSETLQTQSEPTPALFMSNNAAPAPLLSATNLSSSPFLDSALVPAIEVPCCYGNFGLDNALRGITKPANYNSDTVFATGQSYTASGSPDIASVAGAPYFISSQQALYNWTFATRQTYGALVPLTTGTEDGSIGTPFQLQLGALTAKAPQSIQNLWKPIAPGNFGPPRPQSSTGAIPGPFGQCVSDANGMAMFLVTDSCFVNVGPTAFNTANLGQYTRMALWAFNYSDLFADDSVPQQYLSTATVTGLKNSFVDSQSFMKAYLKGVPYYMDESYDGTTYSTLGRSLFIGNGTAIGPTLTTGALSSSTLKPLVPTGNEPVILILCPASFSPQSNFGRQGPAANQVGTNLVDTLENTFSNSMVYSFTEPYAQPEAAALNNAGPQVYSLAFTNPNEGPVYAFYGLTNQASVGLSGLNVQASRSTDIGLGAVQRKSYLGFNGTPNTSLGRDIRQVYPQSSAGATQGSLTITQESQVDPYKALNSATAPQWPLKPVNNQYLFIGTTLEQPFWINPVQISALYLPLAGLWNGDRDAYWAGDAVTNGIKNLTAWRQMMPNYDGLSLLCEWTEATATTQADVHVAESTSQGPGFTLYAIDRKCANPGGPINEDAVSQNPVNVTQYNVRRPPTVFVLLCDQWRNTIREPKSLQGSLSRLVSIDGVTKPPRNPPFTYGDGSPLTIDFVDCMGPSDYNVQDVQNNIYFGVCNAVLPSVLNGTPTTAKSKPSAARTNQTQTWPTTPWTVSQNGQNGQSGSRVWSPFTGGSFWNTFKGTQDLQDAQSDPSIVSFAPNLWYPTYKWALAATDPNNVWPTSVATNSVLQERSYVLFSCTDGTIRKMLMPATGAGSASSASPFPVFETTNQNTFYNNDINAPNGNPRVYSYTWPGRLYNLTYFANHWWCTADNASVWTTAPCHDGTNINDPAIVASFPSSIIKFRPLSANEGHPDSWISASWPTNLPHKFNLMKIISVGPSQSLFVSSVDGEYIVINQQGQGFNSTLPNSITQDYAVPWLFPNTTTDASAQETTMLYVTDITVVNGSLMCASAVLPRDPQAAPVNWYSNGTNIPGQTSQGPVALPLLSLSFSLPSDNGPGSLTSAQHNVWPGLLTDANVVSSLISLDLTQFNTQEAGDIFKALDSLTTQIGAQAVGSTSSVDFYASGYQLQERLGIEFEGQTNSSTLASGVRRIVKPGALGLLDANLVWFPETVKLDTTTVASYFNIQNADTTDIGSTILSLQHSSALMAVQAQNQMSTATVSTFHEGGLDMDSYTRAFFVIVSKKTQDAVNALRSGSGSSGSGPSGPSGAQDRDLSLGLKKFKPSLTLDQVPFALGTMAVDGNTGPEWQATYVQSFTNETFSGPTPMWNRSISFNFDFSSSSGTIVDNSYAGAYRAVVQTPLNGPLQEYQDSMVSDATVEDFNDLNVYQTMQFKRASAVPANLSISDMAYAETAQAFAISAKGPFGPIGPKIALVTRSTDPNGLPFLTELSLSQELSAIEARFNGTTILGWNPYELKWYCSGIGTNMPDFDAKDLLRPTGIDEASWTSAQWASDVLVNAGGIQQGPLLKTDSRLMLLSADASQGASTLDSNGAQQAIFFTQVFQVTQRQVSGDIIVKPVSRNFSSISVIEFSPNAVLIGGTEATQPTSTSNIGASTGLNACLCWRTNTVPAGDDTLANWSFVSLKTPGTVTAAKFVGYAWYIATWNPTAVTSNGVFIGQSQLFFASINFTVISLLDTWTGLNASLKVTSIDSVTPQSAQCSAADGFEPDPNDPTSCVRICPTGFKPFGNLCVQTCAPPFIETGVPNECRPDSLRARTVQPTINNTTPALYGPAKSITDGVEPVSVNYALTFVIVLLALVLAVFVLSFVVPKTVVQKYLRD